MRSTRDIRVLSAMAMVALVVGHNLVFLATFGAPRYAGALAQTGHGLAWSLAIITTAAIGTMLLILAVARIHSLTSRTRQLGGRDDVRLTGIGSFALDFMGLWLVLVVVALAAFLALENAERLAAGQQLPGLIAITSAPLSPLVVFAAVSFVVAFVAALFRWRAAQLLAEILVHDRRKRASTQTAAPGSREIDRRPESAIGRRVAGRAPPSVPSPLRA